MKINVQNYIISENMNDIIDLIYWKSRNYLKMQIILLTFATPNKRRCINMLVVNVKENESIDKALKRFKKKFEKTGVLRQLRKRQAFEKPSVARRNEIIHARYVGQLRSNEDI